MHSLSDGPRLFGGDVTFAAGRDLAAKKPVHGGSDAAFVLLALLSADPHWSIPWSRRRRSRRGRGWPGRARAVAESFRPCGWHPVRRGRSWFWRRDQPRRVDGRDGGWPAGSGPNRTGPPVAGLRAGFRRASGVTDTCHREVIINAGSSVTDRLCTRVPHRCTLAHSDRRDRTALITSGCPTAISASWGHAGCRLGQSGAPAPIRLQLCGQLMTGQLANSWVPGRDRPRR